MYVNQLKAAFPHLRFLDTAYSSLELNPAPQYIDYHNYNVPSWFSGQVNMFDSYPRSGPQYFVGEYAVINTNASDIYGTPATGRLIYPIMQGSAAEAAFMTGMERNSDVVFASACELAPSFRLSLSDLPCPISQMRPR
jgi:alpha-N-arabinofuranosidase